jgi:GxxExxY protein
MVYDYQVSGLVIGCAIEVHKSLGPGLKEQSYSAALCEAFKANNVLYEHERSLRVDFLGIRVGSYRPDFIVQKTVVVEVKSVDRLVPVFTSQ